MENKGDLTPWLTQREWIRRTEKMDLTFTSVIKSPWIALSLIFGTQSECDISHLLGSRDFACGSWWELIKETGTSSGLEEIPSLVHRAMVQRFIWSDSPRFRGGVAEGWKRTRLLPLHFSSSGNFRTSAFISPLLWPMGTCKPHIQTIAMTVSTLMLPTFCVLRFFFFPFLKRGLCACIFMSFFNKLTQITLRLDTS